MYTFEKSIFINRPLQEVFDFVSNPANLPHWQSATESGQWTSTDPHGIGSTFKVVRKFMGRDIAADVEITDWNPPKRYRYETVTGPLHVTGTSRFEPTENGTQLILEGQISSTGPFKVLEGFVGKQAEKQDGKNFETLKLILDAG